MVPADWHAKHTFSIIADWGEHRQQKKCLWDGVTLVTYSSSPPLQVERKHSFDKLRQYIVARFPSPRYTPHLPKQLCACSYVYLFKWLHIFTHTNSHTRTHTYTLSAAASEFSEFSVKFITFKAILVQLISGLMYLVLDLVIVMTDLVIFFSFGLSDLSAKIFMCNCIWTHSCS